VEPTSPVLIVGLLSVAVGTLAVAVRRRRILTSTLAIPLALSLAVLAGVALVNDYYGYYRTWAAVRQDFGPHSLTLTVPAAARRMPWRDLHGRLESIRVLGSGIDRSALVYLPPQYQMDPAGHFPLVELLHGSPGQPLDWVTSLQIVHAMDSLISAHQLGPLVLVMPSSNSGHDYEECVNGPSAADETYVADDVPAYLRAHYRVSGDAAQLGIAGFSSGGYCAANLALRERDRFGAAAVLDGYFRAQDGPAAAALGRHPALLPANSPLDVAARLRPGSHPLPAFWVMAGTGAYGDYLTARSFVAELDRCADPAFVIDPGAGHNFYAWQKVVPSMLVWLWTELASPDQRAQYPVLPPPPSALKPVPQPLSSRTTLSGTDSTMLSLH
jgi:poly(3-hydroxybutyrate) depolymerase